MKEIIITISILKGNKIFKAKLVQNELAFHELIYEFSHMDILITKKDKAPFEILQLIRMDLELANIHLLCQGSRVDVYPSGMLWFTDLAYIQTLGKPCLTSDLVSVFDPVNKNDIPKLKTVKEQEEYREEWLGSLKNFSK